MTTTVRAIMPYEQPAIVRRDAIAGLLVGAAPSDKPDT